MTVSNLNRKYENYVDEDDFLNKNENDGEDENGDKNENMNGNKNGNKSDGGKDESESEKNKTKDERMWREVIEMLRKTGYDRSFPQQQLGRIVNEDDDSFKKKRGTLNIGSGV